jgi:hypothetical protein
LNATDNHGVGDNSASLSLNVFGYTFTGSLPNTTSSGPNDTANNFGISYMTISVPEPSTFALIGLGVSGLLFFRRRK